MRRREVFVLVQRVAVSGDGFVKLAFARVRQAEAVMRFGVSAAPIGDGAATSSSSRAR